ncbi:hypothetical protein CROQUDRAFT_83882 [Cronartium quercuum f. sp. fusiforme G11]|uniref:RNase H type-1 domain-containing protein n=1 Tax=Cronartium quercuum f. sp. fusiforme G11 TaxID=708437 RepID=A0A9P6T6H8_9BASI|nr:hypothetical protein CROQUDRAFT_83882 [Cronartium quercuum f. sp. fusiforme G11]
MILFTDGLAIPGTGCAGVFCDNQAAIHSVNDPPSYRSGQYLAIAVREIAEQLPIDFKLRFYWTPGHENIELNERADTAAKEAAEEQDDPLILRSSLGILLQRIKAHFNIRKYNFNPGRPFLTSAPKKIADSLSSLEKGHAAVIFQLRSDHNPLNAYLHRFNLSDSDLCATCKVPETTTHFLLHCRRFNTQRQNFRHKVKKEKIKINLHSAKALLDTPTIFPLLADFVLHTKRFTFFVSYLPDPK